MILMAPCIIDFIGANALLGPEGGRGPWTLGYNEFDFFLENKEYRPFDGCKIEI
jgi:hypothetical protein